MLASEACSPQISQNRYGTADDVTTSTYSSPHLNRVKKCAWSIVDGDTTMRNLGEGNEGKGQEDVSLIRPLVRCDSLARSWRGYWTGESTTNKGIASPPIVNTSTAAEIGITIFKYIVYAIINVIISGTSRCYVWIVRISLHSW